MPPDDGPDRPPPAAARAGAPEALAVAPPLPPGGDGDGGGTHARETRLVVVLGLAAFASSLATRALDPLLVGVARDFAASAERVALLASAFALPYAFVQPVLGPVGDALGKRRVIAACAAVLGLSLLGCALAPSLDALFVARVLSGAAGGGVFPLILAAFGDAVPVERRQVALSRVLACAIGGQIAGGVVGGLLADAAGWRGVMAICAATALLAAAVLAREVRRAPDPPAVPVDPPAILRRYREIAADPRARVLFGGVAAEGALVFAVFPFLAALLYARGIGDTATAGFALGAFGVGGVTYTVLAPVLLRALGQPGMMRLGGAMAGAALAGIALAPSAAALVGAMLALGCGYFMLHNTIQARVTEVAPGARGSAVALHAFSFFVGQSLGPVLFGAGLATVGPDAILFAAALGTAALGGWMAARR